MNPERYQQSTSGRLVQGWHHLLGLRSKSPTTAAQARCLALPGALGCRSRAGRAGMLRQIGDGSHNRVFIADAILRVLEGV